MYYGMRVARKLEKKLTSKKNWKGTLCKIKDEFILISLTHLLEHATMGADGIFVLSGGVTAIIALTEIWSIIENLNTLDPDGPWKVLGKFLKKKGEDFTGVEFDLKNNKK
jgi:phage-related holin